MSSINELEAKSRPGVDGTWLLTNVAVAGPGRSERMPGHNSFQAIGLVSEGSGAVAVAVEVSNNGVDWETLGRINLVLSTAKSSDGFTAAAPWVFVRGNVLSINGTGASVSLIMGG